MPLQQLQFRPGVNREGTTLSNEGGWFESQWVRFKSGYPQKIGGWTLLSRNAFIGTCRSLWNWVTLRGFNLVSLGTESKVYIEYGGEYYDITPLRATVTLTDPFTTNDNVGTERIVTVTDTAHGAVTGDYVTFSGVASPIGGVPAEDFNKEFYITYVDANTYTITVSTEATSAATGGGTVTAEYQLAAGKSVSSPQVGWGTGLWGGVITGAQLTTLNGTITSSTTPIVVNSTVGFPASGTILIDSELITYSGTNTPTNTQFTGITRGAFGTTAAAHTTGATVTNASSFTGWGDSVPSSINDEIRLWSQANFGQNLLFCPRGGSLYLWTPGDGPAPAITLRAEIVDDNVDIPTKINSLLVADAARIVIAFGCNDYPAVDPDYTLDPLLIRWSAQESYTDWTFQLDGSTQAGYYRLSHGSRIIGAIQTRQEILVWTDAAIYAMQYVGPPNIWSFTLLADNISIVSPSAMATASGVVYWMGVDKFYVYSGRVETLPCALRSYVYNDINRDQFQQVFSGTNEGFSEVWWYYCSANSNTVDRYVIFNYLDRVWYYGSMPRTAWLDSALRPSPMAATYGSKLVYHEQGNDDGTTNPPSAIASYIQSADFDIGDGHNYGFVWRMIPDITFDGSTTPSPLYPNVTFSMRPRQNPGSNYNSAPTPTVSSTQTYSATTQTYNVQQFTEIVYTRVRGRQLAFKISSSDIGVQWQLGVPRMDVRPDGRR